MFCTKTQILQVDRKNFFYGHSKFEKMSNS